MELLRAIAKTVLNHHIPDERLLAFKEGPCSMDFVRR